jgi:rsbT co-antagonist protein RsbR
MDDEARRLLREILRRRRTEILEEATDWVRGCAIDLGTKRPREETLALSETTLAGYEAALLDGDMAPLNAHIRKAIELRAKREFHISTLLRGVLSIRWVLARFLREDVGNGWAAFDILSAVDSLYYDVSFAVADAYATKLNATIDQRRRELEEELEKVTAAKMRELDEKIVIIEAQRRTLATLSSPVIRVWEGILVMPLVGDITEERSTNMIVKALGAIQESGASVLIIDATGVTHIDNNVALRLVPLVQAVKLIGAGCFVVGVSATMARTLVDVAVDLGPIGWFGTLHEGLRAALRSQGRQSGPRARLRP